MTSSDPQAQVETDTPGRAPAQWWPDLLLARPQAVETVPFQPSVWSSRQAPGFEALQVRTEPPPAHAHGGGRHSSSKPQPEFDPHTAWHDGAASASAAEEALADAGEPGHRHVPTTADTTLPPTATPLPGAPAAGHPAGAPATAGPADAAAAQALQDAAYARGLSDGQARARARDETARQRQESLLKQLLDTLEHHAAGAVDWSTPMKRLCLRLAEEIVRGELQHPRIVERLVEQGLAALGGSSQRPVVRMHPDDLAVLSPLLPRFEDRCHFEAVAGMSRGSVEVAADDTLMQDLIENRVRSLAEQLFQDDDAGASGVAANA